jgi:hypothetical protein
MRFLWAIVSPFV